MTEVKIKCPRCKNIFTTDQNFIAPTLEINEDDLKKKAKELAQVEIEKMKKTHDLEKEHLIETQKLKDQRTKAEIAGIKAQAEKSSKKFDLGSNEIDGEAQEIWLEKFLMEKFPRYPLEEVKKGTKGADCIMSVKYKDEVIGKILFESKYGYPSFQSNWVSKLKTDMRAIGAEYGVIVSTVLPSTHKEEDPYINYENNTIFGLKKDKAILSSLINRLQDFILLNYQRKQDEEKRLHNKSDDEKQERRFISDELLTFMKDQDNNIKQEYLEHDKLEKDLNKIIKNSKKRIDKSKADFDSLWRKTIELDSVPDDFLD